MKARIDLSDLMIVNRAVAHDNMPTEKAFFIDDEGRYRPYKKRMNHVMKAKETAKEIERVCSKLLSQLSESDAKKIRKEKVGFEKSRDKNLSIILDLVSENLDYETVKEYAPNLLKMM